MMAKATVQSAAWKQVGERFVLLRTDVKRRLDDLGDVKLRQDVTEIVDSLRHAVASTFAGADDRPAAVAPRPSHKPAPKPRPAPKSSARPANKTAARPAKKTTRSATTR